MGGWAGGQRGMRYALMMMIASETSQLPLPVAGVQGILDNSFFGIVKFSLFLFLSLHLHERQDIMKNK
jgi:hypothetical protein